MKRTSCIQFLIIAIATMLGACKNAEGPEPINKEGEMTINFCVVNYKQYPMDDLARCENSTRATLAEELKHLNLTVFGADGNKFTEILQESGDEGYGTFSLKLPYGTYSLVFFGYNGSKMVEISSATDVHFSDGYVPNCFYKHLTLNVDENTQATHGIVLERPVACFTIECQPADVPKNIHNLNYVIEGTGASLNATTGFTSKMEVRQGSLDVTQIATRSVPINIYSFLPDEECEATFTLTATDNNGSELKTRTLKKVPLKINHKTIYTGNFFSNDQDPDPEAESSTSFSISLDNSEWERINYPN